MVECILSAWGCGCANLRLTRRSPIVRCIHFCVWWIFSWIEAATFLTGQFAAEWCIRIWIWCENQTLWLKCHSLSLTFYTASRPVMTWYHIMELVAPLAEHWLFVDSDRGDWPLLLWWLVIARIICERWPWTPALLRLEQLVWIAYFFIWRFCITWLFGDSSDIYSALVLLETCHCNVEQNFCPPLLFMKLELFWPSEMLLEIKQVVWRSFMIRTTLYRTVVIIYFVLECKDLWLFTIGWEPRVFENFWK